MVGFPDMKRRNEAAERDRVLDLLEERRRKLIQAVKLQAVAIYERRGYVTSVLVLQALERNGWDMDGIDRRFMGPVFRTGWRRIGWEATGSHCRPVAKWVRA